MSKDCRKFQPNIFNKSKCTNCFRQREEHSAEALESNRASRKVSKCGYLFVAPDWDFAIPLNRTKRWQRRWFVLYDDGELTYSVDDHPATIPQGVVNMNRVLEVTQAEDITGNQFSLAITSPDRVTFIKGTCREESKWWMDVLSVFPRTHKQQGRHKRNATFPGIKTTTVLKQNQSPSTTLAPTTFESSMGQRVRFHSCTSDPLVGRPPSAPAMDIDEDVFPTKDSSASSTPIPPSTQTPTPLYHSTPLSSLPPSTRMLRDEHKENTPPYPEDYIDNPPTSESPPTQDKLNHKFRTRRAIKREARGLTQPRSKSEMSALLPANLPPSALLSPICRGPHATTTAGSTTTTTPSYSSSLNATTSLSSFSSSLANSTSYSTPDCSRSLLSPTPPVVDPLSSYEGRPIRRATIALTSSLSSLSSINSSSTSSTLGMNSSLSSSVGGTISGNEGGGGGLSSLRSLDSGVHVPTRPHPRTAPDKPGEVSSRQLLLSDLEETKREEKLKDIADSITRLRGSSSLNYLSTKSGLDDVKPTRERDVQDETNSASKAVKTVAQDVTDGNPDHQIRGDPDGCGLEVSPPYAANPDLQRVDLPAEDLLYIKKGWLMKLSLNQEWNKYWFVLRGPALTFYRDPSAEDNGILDGIIDLGVAKSIEECEVGRNYGFMIMTWEEKKYVFSAVTSGIRGNWIQALRNAANLKESKDRPLTLGEQIEREIVAKRDRHNSQSSTIESMAAERDQGSDMHNDSISSANSRCVFSSDDEYRTASETSGCGRINNNDDYFEWEHTRSRSNSRSRVNKRSRSSPPSSRHSTRDDFPSVTREEVLTSCFSEAGSLQSITDLDDKQRPEKDGSATTITGSGDALLVDLLETQVESLKAKLEQTQSPSSRSRAKLELSLSESRETIAPLIEDLNRLRKKLEVCEGDLDRSEREVDKLRRDKEEMSSNTQSMRQRVASLEMQIKELLDRIEEQEHDLSEKASCAKELSEMRKKYNALLERLSSQSELHAATDWKHHYDLRERKYLKEREEWEERLKAEEQKFMDKSASQISRHDDIVRRLNRSLQEAEKRIQGLVVELETERASISSKRKMAGSIESSSIRRGNQELTNQIEHLTNELTRMRDNVKSEKSEVYKWKDLVKELRSLLDGKNDEIERKRDEVEGLRESLKATQKDLDHTADRLQRGIEENENLCCRIRELERNVQESVRRASSNLSISSSRERFSSKKNLPRIDSLSDLTNFDVILEPDILDKEQLVDEYNEIRLRFEKAIKEIMALKREIREIQNQQDDMELSNLKLKQDLKGSEGDFNSQMNLMTLRIQDLTNKLTNSEKQVRLLKQKLSRAESRDRRRTQSLKGRESFALSRDMEVKLSQLEAKIEQLIRTEPSAPAGEEDNKVTEVLVESKSTKRSKSFDDSTKSSRLRRKSLDSPASSEAMKAIVRLNTLESKVSNLVDTETTTSSSVSKTSARPKSPTHPASPLRSPLRSPSMPRKSLRSPRVTPERTVKLNRSESETKHLRERLSNLDKVLTTLEAQLSECVAWAGSVECVCSCGAPGVSSLQQRLNNAIRIAQLRHTPIDQANVTKLRPLVIRLQDMLREKLTELANRRDLLKTEGKWSRDMQLKLFAERLAYETLILSQIAQIIQGAQRPQMYEASVKLQDLIEAHRKLSFLEKKLTNPDFDMETMAPLDFYTSLLAEKLVVQGEVASGVSPQSTSSRNVASAPVALDETCRDLQNRLLERERSLANLVTQYKEGKLHEVAVVMARETVTGAGPPHDDSVLLEEVRMREVWTMAQDLVGQELVNIEAAQSLMRLGHLLIPNSPIASAVTHPSTNMLERWHTAAEESLRQEMEEAVFTLSNKYEAVLAQYRAGDTGVINSVSASMETVLSEFASVVAQKAVIDGQLAIVQGDGESGSSTSEPLTIVEETRDTVGSASDVVASEAHLLMFLGGCDSSMESLVQPALDQAEFTFMYNKVIAHGNSELSKLIQAATAQAKSDLSTTSLKCSSSLVSHVKDGESESLHSLSQSSPGKMPPSPKSRRKSESSRRSRRASDITGMAEGCRQCEELRQEVAKLKRNLDSKRMKERESECKQCLEFMKNLKVLEQDHKIALVALQSQHDEELARLREQTRHEPPTRDSDDELTELKRRLCLLEEGYEAQIIALKKQYEDALGSQPDMCEEKVRQRYQKEIEHLRGLCEKGLSAMENSHKRIIAELEEKHRRELAALQAEKEQALAEETQATLAALDAMRKAHEAEVQREIGKFKEEFIRKMQSGHDIGAIHKEHEAEMEDIRHEILSLSQKYSIKCLESAALEEKVEALNKQLTDASKHVFDLEARNKQLKAHLSAQVSQLQDDSGKGTFSQVRLLESELVLRNEEIARLNQQLQQAQSHEADRGELCRQLGHFLKAERQLRTDEVSSLREKLERIILTAANMQEQCQTPDTYVSTEDKSQLRRGSSLSITRSTELMRSPSCPRLSGFSSFLSVGPSPGGMGPPTQMTEDLPSPLAGMVASRKKVFEISNSCVENM